MLFKLLCESHKPLSGFCKLACGIVKIVLPKDPSVLQCFEYNGAIYSYYQI